jgi:hypothetical protein
MLLATCLTIAAVGAAHAAADVHFYEQEKFTVVYEVKGSPENGAVTEHVDAWGNRRVEIKKLTMSIAGIAQTTKQRVIYDGASIITVDLQTGTVTRVENPLYAKIVASMKGRSGVDYGREWAAAMGAKPTGKTRRYAGLDCGEWTLPGLGTTMCVTRSGLTLRTETNMGPVKSTRTATQVTIGTGGPASAYQYDASRIRIVPNLEEIMKKARGGH